MSQSLEDRLKAVVVQKKEKDEAIALADAEAKRLADEKARKLSSAKSRWFDELYPLLKAVVEKVNQGVAGAGLELLVKNSNKLSDGAIAQVCCELIVDNAPSDMQIVFNVRSYGEIASVLLIPHTGPSSKCHIDAADEAWMTDLIIKFLELAVASKKSKKK